MVVSEPEILSPGEAESILPQDQHIRNQMFSSLGRQSSIYSLTLDEFQHTLCDGGKNFGSMNMDEFLNSIWAAEENQAVNNTNNLVTESDNNSNDVNLSLGEDPLEKKIVKQPSLPRQGSLTLPLPLCHKTVDEVWSEIHKNQHQGRQKSNNKSQSSASVPRQPTFGEMTLEDFLVKAGVVREQSTPQQQYTIYQNSNPPSMGCPTFVSRTPVMKMATVGGGAATYPPICYSGRMGNGGGYDTAVGPVSPDGIGTSQGDSGANMYGLEIGGPRGRKRTGDGPVEKVVERRQRRMIKNRESAARSRARKQAYTVELEAELNQLREENAHLKQTLTEIEMKRKQQYFEEEGEN